MCVGVKLGIVTCQGKVQLYRCNLQLGILSLNLKLTAPGVRPRTLELWALTTFLVAKWSRIKLFLVLLPTQICT